MHFSTCESLAHEEQFPGRPVPRPSSSDQILSSGCRSASRPRGRVEGFTQWLVAEWPRHWLEGQEGLLMLLSLA